MPEQISLLLPEPTPRQRLFLDCAIRFIQEKGYSPSMADIAETLKVTPAGARVQIDALVKKGWLCRVKGVDRSISLPQQRNV